MRRAAGLPTLLLVALTACGETGPGFRTVGVEVIPAAVVLDAVGAQASLRADVTDSRGDPVFGTRVVWTSADESIATVDASGTVTARGPGSTTVTATATGLGILQASGSATVEVVPAVVRLLQVDGVSGGVAGEPLATPIRVRALDRLDGLVVGVPVRFQVTEGGGTVAPEQAVTDAAGEATAVWTLGASAGTLQRLRAFAGDEPAERIFETVAIPGPPAAVEIEAGADQYGIRSNPLSEAVRVRVVDAFGNGVPGGALSFEVTTGGGRANPETGTTDLTGGASTAWVLGPAVGVQRMQVVAGAAATDLSATATEPPAALAVFAGDGGTARVGEAVDVAPAVRVTDAAGAPVPGIPVLFTVTAGGGTVEAGAPGGSMPGVEAAPLPVPTDAQGVAALARWTLGTRAGVANQAVRAEVTGLPARVFTASATPGPPATLQVIAGANQTAAVTTAVPVAPTVRVDDPWGNPVPGVTVAFTPEGGYVTPPTTSTDGAGRASTAWTLGPLAGEQRLTVDIPGSEVPAATLMATATGTAATCVLDAPADGFDLQLCPVGALDPTAMAAVEQAVQRWEQLVVGDLPDALPNADHASCVAGAPWVTGPVDDLVLYVEVRPVDGQGGGLAGAAPCFVRAQGGLPLFARLVLDADDVAPLEAAGRLVDVVLHEIGHALGVGTLWAGSGYLRDPSVGSSGPPPDTWFAGPEATAAFDAAGGAARTVGPKVPVQNTGGGGVADVHWRESVLGPELLTAFLDAGVANPLSRITAASLADLGYVVDVNRSDPYMVPFPDFPISSGPDDSAAGVDLGNDIWWGPFGVVDAHGSVLTRLRPPGRRP